MMDPYAHPQLMEFVKHLSYFKSICENYSMLSWSLNHCTFASFVLPRSAIGFQLTSQIKASTCGGNGVMMDPYANPQLMQFVKHVSYFRSICENYSMLG